MNEYDLPIDIHANKLIGRQERRRKKASNWPPLFPLSLLSLSEWLVSRQHCCKDWKPRLDQIRGKIRNALKDMPQHETILKILSEQNTFNYYICKQIVEILKETEKNTKNIFGFYTSERMKEWQEILSLYETDGVFLAETAQILVRNVTYEIPSLKKNINRMQQLHDEYSKKEDELTKQAHHFKRNYYEYAHKIGLKGDSIVDEINELLSDFPQFLRSVVNRLSELERCRTHYVTFLFFLSNLQQNEKTLPLIRYLLEKGNTTYFEYVNGQAPEIVEEVPCLINEPVPVTSESDEDKIDFGEEIDFGDTHSSPENTTNGDFVHIEKVSYEMCIEL